MKAATLFVFALVIVAVTCRPDKPDLKQVKAEAARKKACMHDCSAAALDPVCAGKQGEKPKSFGNECVMNNYNCEHHDKSLNPKEGQSCFLPDFDFYFSSAMTDIYGNKVVGKTLHKLSKGECAGSDGIRLS